MKKILLFAAVFFAATVSYAQVILSDDFESYTPGAHMSQSDSINWTTWDNLPGSAEDGYISNVQASSGTNSLMISKDNDQVWLLGDSTSGKYEISLKIYVPADSCGYFNLLHKFAGGASDWSNEVLILPHDSTFRLYVGGNDTAHVVYTFDTWHSIVYSADIDADLMVLTFDGDTVFSWPFSLNGSGNTGVKQIGGMDFFGYDIYKTGNVRLYIDDVKFERYYPQGINNAFVETQVKLFPNPATDVVNIRTTREMKTAKVLDMSGSVVRTFDVNSRDLQIDVENLASGLYYVQINFGSSIAVRKMVVK